jgi:hypothetical protein
LKRTCLGMDNVIKTRKRSPASNETKLKISRAHMGMKLSSETRTKMSIAHKGKRVGINNPMWGKHHSIEQRAIMSAKLKILWATPEFRDKIDKHIRSDSLICSVCGGTKRPYTKTCRACYLKSRTLDDETRKLHDKQYRESHKQEEKERGLRWRASHKEHIANKSKMYYANNKDKIIKHTREYGASHKKERAKTVRERLNRVKAEVLTRYGNNKLACLNCGLTDIRALSIDHVNGGGSKHRKASSLFGVKMYAWLKANHYPTGYQTLCMSCQFIKRVESNENNKWRCTQDG